MRKKIEHPVMGCYYRTWRDTATGAPENKTSMKELPAEVDIAFIFPDGNEPETFWRKLETDLIPAMHQKGIKVLRTVAIDELIKEGATAEAIWERFFTSTPGLDGLDIDIEHRLNNEERRRALDISLKLRALLGDDKFLVYDLNINGDIDLIESLEPHLDYVLLQAYGQNAQSVQSHFDRLFASFLPIEKFLVGFSFYEERGAKWADTHPSIESSTAYAYATWNPTQGRKGGVFSYAVDRDGVAEGDDAIQPTAYRWTQLLKAAMLAKSR